MQEEFVTVAAFNQLIQAMTAIKNKVLALESEINTLKSPEGAPSFSRRSRRQTTYAMYCNVRELARQGFDYKDIAKQLDIPPSTCKEYLNDEKWTPELIEKKKREQYSAAQ